MIRSDIVKAATPVSGLEASLVRAGGDFQVTLAPVMALTDGGLLEVPGRRVVMAGDLPVDVVGSRWEPFQNLDVLRYAAEVGAALGTEVTHCGVGAGNRRFWCRLELEDGDDVGMCALVTSAHTGTGGLTITVYGEAGGALVRLGPGRAWSHGATLEVRLGDPRLMAGELDRRRVDGLALIDRLRAGVVTPEQFVTAWDVLAPVSKATTPRRENHRRDVLDAVSRRWVRLGERSAWSALVAGCCWLDNERPALESERVEQVLDEGGWVVRAKQRALDTLSQMGIE